MLWSLNNFQAGAFNEVGGLHQSSVIEKSLIDHYVPFLPLEREHVKACARVEAQRRGEHLSPGDYLDLLDWLGGSVRVCQPEFQVHIKLRTRAVLFGSYDVNPNISIRHLKER